MPDSYASLILKEARRSLLGVLEIALFMPVGRTRFGDTKNEALRSFAVPVLLFPLTLLAVYMAPQEGPGGSAHTLALLYGLRMAVIWVAFFGTVYWIAREVDRRKYFYQFVIASNWLSVPATAVFVPVGWMLLTGTHGWQELYPFMVCLILYTYAFTGFMAAYVLRIPWELAGFIVFVGMCVNNTTLDLVHWVGDKL